MALRPTARAATLHLGLTATLALAVVGAAGVAALSATHGREGTFAQSVDTYAGCQTVLPATDGLPPSCAHEDVAPPGVDVTAPVATAVLEARKGGAAAAVRAAQEEGVAVSSSVASVSDVVPCDGDGSSGSRVQAVYAVAAGKANRYAAVSDQIKQWASGVNTVFNLSAAKTGGVRNVRFVTAANGDGTCSATVLNVTLPATAFSSFGNTITAMRNAGYTSTSRKYLIWADATGQCGIAQTYLDSKRTQDNFNNGYAAQFARIDTACWGQSASVEAHELSHTLGSVQHDAPHATKYGHCTDESDRMCYVDGTGSVMKRVCDPDQEVLFDCHDDDYFSTYPSAGSYLALHWNTADSRFLIGGGDGSGGGTSGAITHLGGTLSLNSPAIPGVATQVSANLEVPAGHTATIAWSSTRADCVFADKTAVQTTLTCNAPATGNAPVTATVTDSGGEKITRTGTVTFAKTARSAAAALKVDGTGGSTYTACAGGHARLAATVLDSASNAPVKGVTVTFLRRVGTAAPVAIGTAVTDRLGTATLAAPVVSTAGALRVRTTAAPTFPAVTSSDTTVSIAAGVCASALTAAADDTSVMAGAPVTLSGTLTRTPSGGSSGPAAGETVTVFAQATGATGWTSVGAASTTASGAYTLVVKPVVGTTYQARFAAMKGTAAATASNVAVSVTPWTTAVTATPATASPIANKYVTVSGKLTKSDGTTAGAMAAAGLQVVYPIVGGKTATASVVTKADGTYSIAVKPTAAGTLTVKYVGKTGWTGSAATVTIAS